MTIAVITRQDYLAKRASFSDYYAQFITTDTLRHVEDALGADRLAAALAQDEHLNLIPLARWDEITHVELGECMCEHICSEHPAARRRGPQGSRSGRFRSILPMDRAAVATTDEWVTRAFLTCIAKTAARIVVDRASRPATD